MIRPATPLTVLLFAAFALLLLSVLSTPIIKGIPLGTVDDVKFGVFGLCKSDGCSPIEIGYDTSSALTIEETNTFNLPNSTRATLSTILIVHPIAALFTLVMLIMAIASHFHAPSHSIRYLLIVFIVSIFTFIASLLSFLVDVLLFVPHMAWGSYLVLAATIINALSLIVSCAMRRTLVSRKSRKKRIEENAEMSGENYYNRQAAQQAVSANSAAASSFQEPSLPMVSGANGPGPRSPTGGEKLPVFATYDNNKVGVSDERLPLTARSPSNRSPNAPSATAVSPTDQQMMMNGQPGMPRSGSRQSSRDDYGNGMMNASPNGYEPRRGPSFEQGRRGGMPPQAAYRGRGGYGPPGARGGYGPPGRGGRGGYGPPGRGGSYGQSPVGRGGYGPPPRGYAGGSMRGRTPPPGYQYENRSPAYDMRGQSPGPQGYNQSQGMQDDRGMRQNMNPAAGMGMGGGAYEAYAPEPASDLPRAESPPPLPGVADSGFGPPGTAIEMDATTGSPQNAPHGFGQFRDSDVDIAGMVGLQQGMGPNGSRHDTYISDMSRYSQDDASQYQPPRAAWANGRNSPRVPSPLNVPSRNADAAAPVAELPAPVVQSRSPPPAPNGGTYYEDADPRFETDQPQYQPQQQPQPYVHPQRGPPRPTSRTSANRTPVPIETQNPNQLHYDEIPPQPRSPAESERSNFTSISQRGVNPRWQPPPMPMGYPGSMPPRRPVRGPDPNTVLLDGNPDFALPGQGSRNNAGSPPTAGMVGRPGMSNMGGSQGVHVPGSAYPAF